MLCHTVSVAAMYSVLYPTEDFRADLKSILLHDATRSCKNVWSALRFQEWRRTARFSKIPIILRGIFRGRRMIFLSKTTLTRLHALARITIYELALT